MRQLTLRVDEDLADRLKAVAGDRQESVNGFAQRVLRAAVDPELAGDDAQRLRERLARAGLLATFSEATGTPPAEDAVTRARAEAGGGRPLSDFVSEGRG